MLKYLSYYQGLNSKCWESIILNLINAIFVAICFFLTLYFVDYLNLSIKMAGFLVSCYGIGTVVGGYITGKICDKRNPNFIRILCLLIQGISFLLLGIISNTTGLLLILFILGFGGYGFKTTNSVLMLNACTDRNLQLKTINIAHIASNLGLGFSGLIIGFLKPAGYSTFFLFAGSILICAASYIYLIQYPKPYCTAQVYQHLKITSVFQTCHKNYVFEFTILSVFFVGLIMAQLSSTYPLYIKQNFVNLGTRAVGILFILDTVLIILFQAPLSNYYRKYSTLVVLGIGAFLMGLGMIILSLSVNFFLAIISCIIWTTGEILFLPSAQLLCYESCGEDKKGKGMGYYQSAYATSTVIGPLFGCMIYAVFNQNTMWYISGIIGLICLIGCILLFIKNSQIKSTTI